MLFTLGINTAFRANELLFIKAGQVRYLKPGDDLEIKLSKTKTYRRVTINQAVTDALGNFFRKERPDDGEWIFKSKQTGGPLKVSTLSNMVKSWCRGVGLAGNYASHTLRKTWGYWQRTECDTPIPLLMAAYGHSNQRQTLSYLCIQDKEIAGIYMSLVL
ncbi:tyrosine-type recombinase/integrase [Acanthopleuribacter pedis]|uniref:Tyrosine-type recombinase/integrase n=1 Tax=Acanthopleuribacter pedis TaxID=442870 RepID=A0A8J7U278_9BACT|nr:tyrosine-type recombinase/integrase [Acanthopleuribacter pedis]